MMPRGPAASTAPSEISPPTKTRHPAAAAHRLTDHPYRGLALSAALAVLAMWAGLTLSYVFPATPPSFAVVAVATVIYAAAAGRGTVLRGFARRGGRRSPSGDKGSPRAEEVEHA